MYILTLVSLLLLLLVMLVIKFLQLLGDSTDLLLDVIQFALQLFDFLFFIVLLRFLWRILLGIFSLHLFSFLVL